MALTAEKLLEEARALPEEERWRLVEQLLALDDGEPQDFPALEGAERDRFIAGVRDARAEIARGEGVEHDEAQRRMEAYKADLRSRHA